MNDQEIIAHYKSLREHALSSRCACKVCHELREKFIEEVKAKRENP